MKRKLIKTVTEVVEYGHIYSHPLLLQGYGYSECKREWVIKKERWRGEGGGKETDILFYTCCKSSKLYVHLWIFVFRFISSFFLLYLDAVSRINEIIANGLRPKGSRFSPIVRPPSNLPPGVRPPPINQPPPTMMSFQPQHHQSVSNWILTYYIIYLLFFYVFRSLFYRFVGLFLLDR